MRRRSFFQRFAQFAAIVALAPQLAFRTRPIEFKMNHEDAQAEKVIAALNMAYSEAEYEWIFLAEYETVVLQGGQKLQKFEEFRIKDKILHLITKAVVLGCMVCMAAHAQVIQITCPTRAVPGTYTNQQNGVFVVQTVQTPVVTGSESKYYKNGITNLPNVFKNVPSEFVIRTNYRPTTLKILRPRSIRTAR